MEDLVNFICMGETEFSMPVIVGFFAFMCFLWFISSIVDSLINAMGS